MPNFEVIAAKTGRSVKECVNMYDKNQAFLSLPDGVASATALRVDERLLRQLGKSGEGKSGEE